MSDQKVCPTCGTEYPLSERFCPRDGTALRSASQTADLLGSVVADRYHILKKLGEGGMGTVYLAEHVKMGRKSALKVMNPGMSNDPDAIARFNREASNASRLSHPNICGIYDFGETPDGVIYLAMEFVEGKALTEVIAGDGSLPAARAARIVQQTGDGLQVAHDAGIVHRDLKPDNIMVTTHRDGSDVVKIVDFGIAKASASDAQKVTRTGLVVGTPEYMSPEQLAGDTLDGRSDIYSLALVAFNCLTGTLPFPSQSAQEAMIMRLMERPRTLAEMRPDGPWSARLQEVMDRGLAREAENRYQSAAQFGRDFAEAVAAMRSGAAADDATAVLGAPTSAPAQTKPLPPTRVSGREEAMSLSSVPAAVAKKSTMVPMLIGGAAVALVGVWGATQFLGGGDATTPMPEAAMAPPTQPSGNSSQMNTPANPGTTASPVAQRGPMSASTGVPTPTPEPGSGHPPVSSAGPTIASWKARLEGIDMETDSVAGARVARNALREIEPLMSTLSGIQLDDATYVAMLSYYALGNDGEFCRAAQAVRTSRTLGPGQRALAANLLDAIACRS